jgi:hypothetical protein
MFADLLSHVSQLHIDLLIVFHCFELLAKCLLQLFKSVIWMVLNVVFSPYRDIISKNKTEQVDGVRFYCFTIDFHGFFEHSNVSIRINVFDKG